jgi:hypothetical protein
MKDENIEYNEPRHQNQKGTEVRAHDDHVPKGITNSNKAIKCHQI